MHHHIITSLLSSLFSNSVANNGGATTEDSVGEPTAMAENGGSNETTSLEDHFVALPYTLEAWRLMKTNDPKKTICNLNGCDFLPTSAWEELGGTLARNTRVHELYAENCQLSKENFSALMIGLKHNRSIKTLNFQNNSGLMRGTTLPTLSTHLQTTYWKNNLVVLTLSRTNLSDSNLRALLPGLNGTRIRQLFLNNNCLGGVATNKLRVKENLSYSFGRLEMPELEELYLIENELGREGCEALQYLLRNENSRLKHLSLFRNQFDEGCCRILAEGLKDNSSLETMYIGDNGANDEREPITPNGWEHFLHLVCDDSSIQRTYLSNHVIHDFGDVDSIRVRPGLAISSNLPLVLHEILKINASSLSSARKGRRKVATVHFNGECNLKLLQMKIQLMPHVLEFIGKECSLQALHHTIQNTPALFNYYSLV